MPPEHTLPDAGVPRYLDILFERSDKLPESYFVSMEIDGMYLGEGGFVVMLLEPSMGASAPEYLDLCQRLVRQLHTQLRRFAIHYTDVLHGRVACLLAFPRLEKRTAEAADTLTRLHAIADQLCAEFSQQEQTNLLWVISNMEFGTGGIRTAYSEVCDFLQYQEFMGTTRGVQVLFDPEGATQSQMDENLFLSDSAEKVSRLLCTGNWEDAQAQLSMAVDYCIHAVPCFFPMMRMRLLTLFDHLILAILRENHVLRSFLQQQNILTELLMAPTQQELQAQIAAFWTNLIRHMEALEAQPGIRWVSLVDEYITEMSVDPNLSVSQIALHFGLPQPTLSGRYKQYAGKNITDQIHAVRIRHARQLLQSSTNSLSDIAQQVGYGSLATMNRAFRKYEGLSPSQLR